MRAIIPMNKQQKKQLELRCIGMPEIADAIDTLSAKFEREEGNHE